MKARKLELYIHEEKIAVSERHKSLSLMTISFIEIGALNHFFYNFRKVEMFETLIYDILRQGVSTQQVK